KLDDREWADLVDEAKRRIVSKCRQWTDFNPSDPGMVLVELMAWLTETVLYRLNRIPDLNYIKLLELIGIELQPANPAKAWVAFTATGPEQNALKEIPAGAEISTIPQGDGETLTFETTRSVNLTSAKIIKTASRASAHPSAKIEFERVHE